MLPVLHRAGACSRGATLLLESHARALFSSAGKSSESTPSTLASTSYSTSTSTATTAAATPTKFSSTDLVSTEPGLVRIDAYDSTSFELSIAGGSSGSGGGAGRGRRHRVKGPVVVSAPGGLFARWKPEEPSASSSPCHYSRIAGSLSAIASLVSPRPDIVLVGTGAGAGSGGGTAPSAPSSSRSPVEAMRRISDAAGGAAVEFYPTPQAASLYNVLSQEGRSVLAAMLPAGESEGWR